MFHQAGIFSKFVLAYVSSFHLSPVGAWLIYNCPVSQNYKNENYLYYLTELGYEECLQPQLTNKIRLEIATSQGSSHSAVQKSWSHYP